MLREEGITDAAIDIVTSRGYRRLTTTELARELEVSASALYNHTASKREVLIRVQDRINQGIDRSAFGSLPWDQALERWARSYRDCYAQHTAMIPIMAVLPVTDSPHTLQMYEAVARGLADAGWERAGIADVIVSIGSLVLGAAHGVTAPADLFDPGERSDLAPVFADAVRARPVDATAAADESFDVALGAMLDGFRLRLAAGQDRAAGRDPTAQLEVAAAAMGTPSSHRVRTARHPAVPGDGGVPWRMRPAPALRPSAR